MLRRFLSLFRRKRLDQDMTDEMRFHLEMQARDHADDGRDPTAAHQAARRDFGGVDQIQEQCRDQRGWVWLENLYRDTKHAFSGFRKNPWVFAVITGTLALGMGATTALYTVADRVLFRPPPYPHADRLVSLGHQSPLDSGILNSQLFVEIDAFRQRARSIDAYATILIRMDNAVIGESSIGVRVGSVSPEYFSTLGAVPAMGHTFFPAEHITGVRNVVISHAFWRTAFGSDPEVLGRKVKLMQGNAICEVIGVMPEDFAPPSGQRVAIYRPYAFFKSNSIQPNLFEEWMSVVARLAPGVSIKQAQTDLAGIRPELGSHRQAASINSRRTVVTPFIQSERGTMSEVHWVYLGTVTLFFLIAISNASSLVLARSLARSREFNMRIALGCSRLRLLRLIAIENVVLAGGGCVFGLLLSKALLPALLAMAPAPAWRDAMGTGIDDRALVFLAALGVFTAAVLTLSATWRTGTGNITSNLKENDQAASQGSRTQILRSSLLVIQTALAVILLIGTGLMVKTISRLQSLDRGFDPTDKYAIWIGLPRSNFKNTGRSDFCPLLEESIRKIPGILGVTLASTIPTAGEGMMTYDKPDGTQGRIGYCTATPGLIGALGLHLKRGRWFLESDSDRQVVLDESAASELFAGKEAIGASTPFGEVIGVVADVVADHRQKHRATAYAKLPAVKPDQSISLLLRVRKGGGVDFMHAVRKAIFTLAPTAAVMDPMSMEARLSDQISMQRYTLALLQSLALLALGLTALGLISLLAYMVSQRTREIGIRMVLGASAAQIRTIVLRRSLLLVSLGVIVGLPASWWLARFMGSLLYQTAPSDPSVFTMVAVLLLAIALFASWLPARRATRINPVEALRAE